MLPDSVLSTEVVQRGFIYPRNIPKRDLLDYEYGGVDIQDASRGLRVKVWKGEYIGTEIQISAQDVAPVVVVTDAAVRNFGFTFDQNMQPHVAYELAEGTSKFLWFDTVANDFATLSLPSGSTTPRCCHDDNRDMQVDRGASDVILAYVRGTTLYFRAQRERFLTEHSLKTGLADGQTLRQIGLNRGLRLQFMLTPV